MRFKTVCKLLYTKPKCNVKCSVVIMQFPFQTCSVTLTVVGVHSLWNEKFAANNLQTWAAHRAQNKPCIITLIWLAVCINSTCAHASVRNWRRKLCRMQLKMWSWHTTCKVVFWAEHKHTQRSLAVFRTEHIRTQTPLAKKCFGCNTGKHMLKRSGVSIWRGRGSYLHLLTVAMLSYHIARG